MTLTGRDRKIVLILVPLALALAYWFLILAPKQTEADKISKQLTSAQTKRDAAEQQVNQLNTAKASFASDYATVIRLGKAVPTSVDMPALIVQLNHAARGTGVQIQDFKPGTPSAASSSGSAPGSSGGSSSSGSSAAGAKPGSTGQAGSPPGGGSNPAAPGSAPAQSWPGKQAQKAGNAVSTANNASQGAANATANGPGATSSAGAAGAGGSSASTPGLTQVPLTFTLKGSFFSLADFFHGLKRFVRVVNNRIEVRGRLLTIDSFAFQHAQSGSPNQLQANVNATVYLSPADQGVSAGASPAGPGSAGGAAPGTPASGTSTAPATPTALAHP